MHPGHLDHPLYTGAWPRHPLPPMPPFAPHPHAMLHGFCPSCCHPRVKCCCHIRECRKEAKELLVRPTLSAADVRKDLQMKTIAQRAAFISHFATALGEAEEEGAKEATETFHVAGTENVATEVVTVAKGVVPARQAARFGFGTAFIGGGCCVHLSVEYAASVSTAPFVVLVMVEDSEGTVLVWGRPEKAGTTYQVKEGIVATKPGAHLTAAVLNATARVRWCEIFSC